MIMSLHISVNNNSQEYATFLEMFITNRMLAFPVPVSNPDAMLRRLNYGNRRNLRNLRNKSVTGWRILKYFVSRAGPNVNPSIISKVADELWRTAARHERNAYINLSKGVNRRISKLR
jgi:hypothetical protein